MLVIALAVMGTLVGDIGNKNLAYAGGSSENAVLVVNGESRSSKVIANHYIALRNIPPNHVIYLKGVPTKEIVSLEDFQTKILSPILQELVARRIHENTDYIIYSSDFPTRVNIAPHQKILKEMVGKSFQAKIYAPVASLTSMTYFAAQVLSNDPSYMALNANNYYRIPYRTGLVRPFEGEVQDEYREAISALRETDEKFEDGKLALFDLSEKYPGQAAVYYQLAKFLGRSGETSKALASLSHAVAMGWQDADMISREKDFESLKEEPQFEALLERSKKIKSPFISPHGFRNAYYWAPNGMINRNGQGRRFFLCAMLSVTRDYGISDQDSIDFLTNAASADETNPDGTIYFTSTKDVRTKTRLNNFGPAMSVLEQLGKKARIETTDLPSGREDVLGLSCGTAQFDFEKSGCKFVPGAIADNLTSTGGVFISASQTKLTEFLKFGAAGSSGTVVEPFALQAKFPHPMMHAHYVAGCSLAEAFYQSVHGPYQIILVGDPLCQPFVKRPKIAITSPAPMDEVSGTVKIELSREDSEVKTAGVEIFLNGMMIHRAGNVNSINVDTSDLNDGFHELRVVAVGRDAIESRGVAVLPMMVNNNNQSTEMEVEETTVQFPLPIKVTAKTNFGEKIVIRQNFKTVGVITSESGSTTVSSAGLGVGDIKLQAVSFRDGESSGVASAPIKVTVKGVIASIPASKK